MTAHSSTNAASLSVLQTIGLFAVAICVLTASSYVSVPLYPVPVTMQTLAVLMVGALAGPRIGGAMVVSWLALALMGAPVLAGGAGGLLAFAGPTAGYLIAFPAAAFLAGFVARSRNHIVRFAGFTGLHALILAAGWLWLSSLIGPQTAFVSGVAPFLIGALLKSGLAAALLVVLSKRT